MTEGVPVGIGVLGTGRIGSMHAELLAHRVPGAAGDERQRDETAREGGIVVEERAE